MNETRQLEAGVRLRRFAETIYGQPGVEPLLLELQDQHRCDVLLMLYACWLGHRREVPCFARWAAIVAWHWPWQAQVVTPLRGVRRYLKGDEDAAALYRQVKQCELEAELLQLERLAEYDRGEALDIRAEINTAEQLFACCDAQNIELDNNLRAALEKLAVLAAGS